MRRVLLALCLAALAGPARAAPSGTLVLYTSQPDAVAAGTVAAFEASQPGVHVTVVRGGTTQLMTRLATEFLAGAPKPDVLLIADSVSMEALKHQGRLAPDPSVDISAYPPAIEDPDRTWFATKLITTGILYSLQAPMVPTHWTDLLHAKGGVVLPSPLYSGAAVITAAAFAQDAALGPGFLGKLAAAGATSVPGNGAVLATVAGGRARYGLDVDFMAIGARAKGSPVGFVLPSEGVPAVTEPVAILKTAHNPAAARAFVAFLLSKAGQRLASRQGFIPAMPGIAAPPGMPDASEIKLLPVDVARALRDAPALERQFADDFGG